jgi:tetratricopeptide (TPR) repeat protein
MGKKKKNSRAAEAQPMRWPLQWSHAFFGLKFGLCLFLAVATFAVYYRATLNPFVNSDDQAYVLENTEVQQGLTAATVKWAFSSSYASNWHPLTWLSHALDCQLFGLNPAGHHFSSLVLHILNALLLFLILARATGAPVRSFFVAALFALHPINVESVAWVAERKNLLSMFFLLLSLGSYGWYARRPSIARYLVSFLLFACALAAKPMVVTLPFLLLLIDFWPLQRVLGAAPPSSALALPQLPFHRLVLEKIPLLFLSACSSLLTLAAQSSVISSNARLPLPARLANAVYAYSMYIVRTFWPTRLASFYPYEGLRLATWQVLLFFLFLIGTTVWVWRERARLYLPVGWFWFLGSLVPMIGLVQVGDQAMADRYAYLPFVGIFCILVWGAFDLAQNRKLNLRTLGAVAGLALAVLSFMTWRQVGVWKSSYDLWSHALEVTTDNYMAENYVGTAELVQTFEATGQRYSAEALLHFQNAVRINPADPISHLNLGADLHEHGHLPEAIEQYKAVLQLTRDPHLLEKSLLDLGAAEQQLGHFSEGREYDLQVLKMDPSNEIALDNLGKLAMEEQIQQLAHKASTAPSATAYFQLGELQQGAQHIPEALASYHQALELDPKFQEARRALEALSQMPAH